MLNFINLKNNRSKIIAIIFGFCLFNLCYPYFVWHKDLFFRISFFLIMLFTIINIRLVNITKFNMFVIIMFSLCVFYEKYSRSSNIFGYLGGFILILIFLLKKDKYYIYLKYFKYIFCLSLLLSLFTYIFIVFFNIDIHYNLISPLNDLKGIKYFQYPFLVSEGPLGFKYLNIRFCGMFDEPGVVGSMTIMLLFADNFNLRSKQNIILFIAGIFSFSFYFYLSIFIFFIYLTKKKIRLLFIFSFFIFYLMSSNNEFINALIWDRFTFENGWIKGDNRSTGSLDDVYQDFIYSNDLLWGKGEKYAFDYGEGSSSYKMSIVQNGLVFSILIILTFSLYAYKNIKQTKYFIGYLFLFLGMLYQRPGFLFTPSTLFLFIASIYSINKLSEKESNSFKKTTFISSKL